VSKKQELNLEDLEKVSGGAYGSYSSEVDDANMTNYLGAPLYFVGNQTFPGSSYVQYVEVQACLNDVRNKTFEYYDWRGFSSINLEKKIVTKRVYQIVVLNGNCKVGDHMELIAEGFKVYLSKD